METLKLTNENIDMLSEKVAEMYSECGCTRKETMRARLILEEALIKYQKRFGEETELYFKQYRVFTQSRFLVRLLAPSFDPFTLEENPMAFMIQSVMASFEGNMPSWKYRNYENELVFTIRAKPKVNGIVQLAFSFVLAIVLALLARTFLPEAQLSAFVTNYVSPLSNAYAGLFCVMAVLLTFFAITLSIVQIGDMAVVGAIGGKLMRRFYLMTATFVLIAVLAILPFYHVTSIGSATIAAKSIYDILIGFVPSNLVAPFLNFNSIHIIIVGLMFGFSLLYLGQKGETLVKVFNECNLVSIYTNNFLNKFITLFVLLKVFELIISSDLTTLSNAGRMVAMIVAGELLLFVFYTVYVCLKLKISLHKCLSAFMPTFLVCLSSANFGAAFNTAFDGIAEVTEINEKANLSISVGGVVFRPACTLVFVFSAFSMASYYGIEISLVWILEATILSILLVAAIPNTPGVSVSVITLLYAQLGLPASAVGLMIAVNAPLQFLTVAVDTYCLCAESACFARWKNKK